MTRSPRNRGRRGGSDRRRPRRPDGSQRLWRGAVGLVVLLVIGAVALLDRSGRLFAPAPAPADAAERYDGAVTRVVRVIDGDTLEVGIPDPVNGRRTTRLRLLGVDTPELARDGRPAEPFAEDAAARLAALVEGREVRLDVEPGRERDRFDRLLAHVFVTGPEGEFSAGERLVREGLAEHVPRWHDTRRDELRAAQSEARRAKTGIWSRRPS